ncbi:MAG TPA: response regulator [Thermoanaerobaculia bacterium]|nr:response regulator [Thermoanaerobaculia bacterium]HUM29611.1 response regulator [Thermoanaerobaculia bacterium]HXK67262.1 response regulator [Thermoanaerobaculia bacterium]
MRILIADDTRLFREQLSRDMEDLGYEVHLAATGAEAIKVFAEVHPEIVVLDCLIPILSGFLACQQIRLLPKNYYPVIILISGVYKTSKYVAEAKKHGADLFLNKPLTGEQIHAAAQKILEDVRSDGAPGPADPHEDTEQDLKAPTVVSMKEFKTFLAWIIKTQKRKRTKNFILALRSADSQMETFQDDVITFFRASDIIGRDKKGKKLLLLVLDANERGMASLIKRLYFTLPDELSECLEYACRDIASELAGDLPSFPSEQEWTPLSRARS